VRRRRGFEDGAANSGNGMTSTAPSGVDPTLDIASLHSLIQLALEAPLTAATIDWPSLCALAERERLLGVTWKVSGQRITRLAPGDVASRWQRKALLLGLNASQQLELLAQSVRALITREVDVVALKGAPLAQRLYGDCTVRPLRDIDLYVPLEQRSIASAVLRDLGWRCTSGNPPEEETFQLQSGTSSYRLEVHSSALDDSLLDHLHLPVERVDVRVADIVLPAQGGRFLPAYLAAHLAKHCEKPLLWAIDFLMLWSALDERERAEALESACECGLSRHLRWAIRLADDVAAAARESSASHPALLRLTAALASHGDAARVLQLISLSDSPRDAFEVVCGRVWPSAWRSGWRHAPAYFARRTLRWFRRNLVERRVAKRRVLRATLQARSSPLTPKRKTAVRRDPATRMVSVDLPKRSLSLTAPEVRRLICDAVEAGGEIWVGTSGQSMHATVRDADQVLMAPLARKVRRGDIVLVPIGKGLMLHRVVRVGPTAITTRGDARRTNDAPVPHREVLARAVAVRRKGQVTALVPTNRFGVAPLVRFFMMETRRRARLTALLRGRLLPWSRQIA